MTETDLEKQLNKIENKFDGVEPIEAPAGLSHEELEQRRSLERADSLAAAERIRAEISEPAEKALVPTRPYGDFSTTQRTERGSLVLSATEATEANGKVQNHKRASRFSVPSILKGSPTATEYDSRVANYSTRTAIIELSDGKKTFAIYNYPLSWVHRLSDFVAKRFTGRPMRKAASRHWKGVFEARSHIPVIEQSDPNVVLQPYIPNMNSEDLLRHNHDMKDTGPVPWAKDLATDGKLEVVDVISRELARVHVDSGAGWGDTVLSNIIITPDKQAIIVDPETQFDTNCLPVEQQAWDLKDLIYSTAGALWQSEGEHNVAKIVDRIFTSYNRPDVIQQLQQSTDTRLTFIKRVQLQLQDLAHWGISLETYQVITQVIKEWTPKE